MRVLGLSGFHRSQAFKRSLLPGASERETRICQGMDAAAVLVDGGRVVAAVAEERLNRRKHTNLLPEKAVRYCLEEGGIELKDVDYIAHSFDHGAYAAQYAATPWTKRWYDHVLSPSVVADDLEAAFGSVFRRDRFVPVRHHLAHAASAYRLSGFSRALVVAADAMGEVHGVSVFDAGPRGIEPLLQMPYISSIGLLYSLVTLHLGFEANSDEYKTMGLAPYGDPARYRGLFENFIEYGEDSWRLNFLETETTEEGRETYANSRLEMARLFFPERGEDEPIERRHMDLAAALQETTDRAMTHLVSSWMKKTSHENLCLAGGVALNCTTNGRLLRLPGVRRLFIQPAAGDDGSALGAALEVAATHGEKFSKMGMPYWGPSSPPAEIEAAFAGCPPGVRQVRHADAKSAADAAAAHLAAGKVVAIYQGRMEFGPRALGNRSILADPRDVGMRDRVNSAVKLREAFRPFAPVVLEERLSEIFEAEGELPYMLVAVPVRDAWKDRLPAVTHVDRSARVQTVNPAQNVFLHGILEAFDRRTGVPVLLNTSFNVKGQPIVHTPQEAAATFLSTGIDSLFFGNLEMTKEAFSSR